MADFPSTAENMYQQAVQDNEYDEFGVSKKKSYQNLTRKEREQMDLQKMADMERLLSSSVLKKIVKKGSENPDEELDSMIGIEPVKQKTREMVARMKFVWQTYGVLRFSWYRKKHNWKNYGRIFIQVRL